MYKLLLNYPARGMEKKLALFWAEEMKRLQEERANF